MCPAALAQGDFSRHSNRKCREGIPGSRQRTGLYCKNKGPIRMGQKLTRLRGHIKGRLIHSSKLQLGRHTHFPEQEVLQGMTYVRGPCYLTGKNEETGHSLASRPCGRGAPGPRVHDSQGLPRFLLGPRIHSSAAPSWELLLIGGDFSEKNSEDRGYGKIELPCTIWVGLANS